MTEPYVEAVDIEDSWFGHGQEASHYSEASPGLMLTGDIKIKKASEIMDTLMRLVREIEDLTALDEDAAITLLKSYKWNAEVLVEAVLGGREKYAQIKCDQMTTESFKECPICYTDFAETESAALACGHRFCVEDWQAALSQ